MLKEKDPNDVLWAWKLFLDELEEKYGHRDATLVMHTDPYDGEGPNLITVSEMLDVHKNVFFSTDRLEFDKMNVLYNVSDVTLNISYAEGFGLSTLESMQTGTPIIAIKTGGLTRQVVDHRDETENGVALDVDCSSLVGSQQVPYIYEDYVSPQTVASAILKIYDLSSEERAELSKKVRDYVLSEFSHQNMIDSWHDNFLEVSENWKKNYKRWECISI